MNTTDLLPRRESSATISFGEGGGGLLRKTVQVLMRAGFADQQYLDAGRNRCIVNSNDRNSERFVP